MAIYLLVGVFFIVVGLTAFSISSLDSDTLKRLSYVSVRAFGERVTRVRWKVGGAILVPVGVAVSVAGSIIFVVTRKPHCILHSECLAMLDRHEGRRISTLAFSSDGTMLATSASDRSVNLWAMENMRLLTRMGAGQEVTSVAWAPDGEILACYAGEHGAYLKRASDGELIDRLLVDSPYSAFGGQAWALNYVNLAFSPDGTMLAGAEDGRRIRVWAMPSVELLYTIDEPTTLDDRIDYGPLLNLVFSPDGITFAGNTLAQVWLWRASDGALLSTLDNPAEVTSRDFAAAHDQEVATLVFSPDGTLLAAGAQDGTGRVWRVADGTLVGEFRDYREEDIYAVAFNQEGTTLAVGFADGTIQQWDIGSGELLHTQEGLVRDVTAASFSPDGTMLVTGDSLGRVYLWKVQLVRSE